MNLYWALPPVPSQVVHFPIFIHFPISLQQYSIYFLKQNPHLWDLPGILSPIFWGSMFMFPFHVHIPSQFPANSSQVLFRLQEIRDARCLVREPHLRTQGCLEGLPSWRKAKVGRWGKPGKYRWIYGVQGILGWFDGDLELMYGDFMGFIADVTNVWWKLIFMIAKLGIDVHIYDFW